MEMDYISIKIEGRIGIITMNKPPVNSFDIQMYNEMRDAFRQINAIDDIWVAVLRGEGKHFSTGNDVNEFKSLSTPEQVDSYAAVVSEGIISVYECRVPVIGAVNGMSLGAGLAVATCCDVLIASENARFGLPEIKIGIVGAACFISRILPQQIHRYMAYTGEMITAEEMKCHGAVLKVVPENQLHEASMNIARGIIRNPPMALRDFKKAINRNEQACLKEKYGAEINYSRELINTDDFKEAIAAFFEKRNPDFSGK